MASTSAYTYNELIAAIQDWAEDDSASFVAALPQVVARGESMVYTDLNLEIFDQMQTGVLTINVNEQPIKTATWQGTRALWTTAVAGTSRTYMQRRTLEYCQDYAPDATVVGQPLYYAELSDTEFFMVPAPDVAYPFVLREIAAPGALAVGNQNTWLGDHQGDILLDACMISAEIHTQSEGYDVDKWKAAYQEKFPQRRMELREGIRSDYTPVKNAARTVDDRP